MSSKNLVPSGDRRKKAFLLGGILLIGLNLRPAITGIAPLAERINASGIDLQSIGLMTTVPLLLFAVVGLWAGWAGSRFGFARTLGLGLFLLSAGAFLRTVVLTDGTIERVAGTILIGAGIALGNVLLPAVVKSRFPTHTGILTSLYSTAMNFGAALGIALALPMANTFSTGWRGSLGAWGVLALFSLVLWVPQMLSKPTPHSGSSALAGVRRLLREPRAWQVTAYMGIQSLLFYSIVAWLPTVLQFRGMSEGESANWVTAMQLTGCVASLVVPTLAGRNPSQSFWGAASALTTFTGIFGVVFFPEKFVPIATVITGVGLSSGFGLALLLIALRSADSGTTGHLSSMAQAIGYLFAAPAPWFIGWLSTKTGNWTLSFGLLLIPALILAVFGFIAGRPGTVSVAQETDT